MFQTGVFPDPDLSFLFLSFFVLFGTFPIFPGFSRFARGWSGDFPDSSLFLFLGLLTAPTRNSPERVRDTIWTFPEKSGKPPGLQTARFSFSQPSRSGKLRGKMPARGSVALNTTRTPVWKHPGLASLSTFFGHFVGVPIFWAVQRFARYNLRCPNRDFIPRQAVHSAGW